MISEVAIAKLLALGQQTRLDAYRLLLEYGQEGLPVSEIARLLDVNLSTLSRHLAQLERASLLRSWRHERQIFYVVDDHGMQDLIGYLTENCCAALEQGCELRR